MNTIYKKLLYGLSALPLGVLYKLSDFLYFLQNYVIKYRKKVVIENLKNSFPEKSDKEIQQISKQFNKNFCDFTVETIKGITISQEEIDQRISVKNIEAMQRIYDEKRNVMVLCGHVFNWEWLKGLGVHLPTPNIFAVYHVAKNELVNEIIKKSREKFNGETIPMQKATEGILRIPNDGDSLFLMVADQSPYKKAIRYDLQFLNQTTPVFQGFDKLARRKNMGIVYLNISKPKRGKYEYEVIQITPDGDEFKENEVVHKFFDLLEKNIQQDPANYMWTHKRWKYKKGIHY